MRSTQRNPTVLKLGGSVLTSLAAYRSAATHLAREARASAGKLVVVVSAEEGHTDALAREARQLSAAPDTPVLDLLWSTGELRSVALLTLALTEAGVPATGLNAHEAGLRVGCAPGELTFNVLALRAALAAHTATVVPGFVATRSQQVVTLGRGGSDWSAVLFAAALGAARCVLVKDVDGYFTEDPATHADARRIERLTYTEALAKADAGCPLVQRQALEEGRRARLTLVVRSFEGTGTVVTDEPAPEGRPTQDNRRRAAMEFSTRTIHAGQPAEPHTGAVVSPIFQTTTYQQSGPGEHRGYDYTRTNNPTRERLETVLAALEGGTAAAVFGSGLAAEHAVLQAYLRPGEEIIVPGDVYGGTFRMLHRVFEPIGCVIKQVDFAYPEQVSAAISPATRLVWLESPTNPRLLVYDIAEISRRAHAGGALVVVDNTFATPFFQRPFELGADLVVHSVTKYLAGHSDLIQGAVIGRDPEVFAPIRFLQNALGGIPSPFDCWLTLRGLKTLELRMLRHAENAAAVADALARHPRVRRVYFPGLETHPGHAVARAQMTGFGGMVSFELDGTVEEASAFVSSLRYFALGESLGGVRALVCLPCKMTHASIPAETRHALGLSDTLIRLSPGCENAKDLVGDIVDGLDRLGVRGGADASAFACETR